MFGDKNSGLNTVLLFVIGVLTTYSVGITCWPPPRQPLATQEAVVPRTIVVAQPAPKTTLEAAKPLAPQPAAEANLLAETPKVLTTEQIAARCEKSIALVSGKYATGTGFLVRPSVLVTNAHVLALERIEEVVVTFPAQKVSMTPELVYEDPQRDLALFAVRSDLPALEVQSDYKFRRGQEVTVIGNPGVGNKVLENAVSRGVMSTQVTVEGQTFYQLNIAVNPGNSGGPTIDSFGKVIGVVSAKNFKLEAMAFCIPASIWPRPSPRSILKSATKKWYRQCTEHELSRFTSMHSAMSTPKRYPGRLVV